jgi:aspartate kinase
MPGTVVGVASERDVIVVSTGRRGDDRTVGDQAGAALLELLDQHRVAGKQLHLADGRVTLVISRENFHEEARVRAVVANRFGDTVRFEDRLGALSVVGAGINASFDNVRRGSAALDAAGIPPAGVSTSSFRITWMVDRARLDDAVRLLHRTFLEQQEPVVP